MRGSKAKAPVFAGSVLFGEDGSVTARYGYGHAVRRLYEYERSGVAPGGPESSWAKKSWERYTIKAPDGTVYPRRGASTSSAGCSAMNSPVCRQGNGSKNTAALRPPYLNRDSQKAPCARICFCGVGN